MIKWVDTLWQRESEGYIDSDPDVNGVTYKLLVYRIIISFPLPNGDCDVSVVECEGYNKQNNKYTYPDTFKNYSKKTNNMNKYTLIFDNEVEKILSRAKMKIIAKERKKKIIRLLETI